MELSGYPEEPRVNTILLSLGSNRGDRVRYLELGLERLKAHVRLEQVSTIYETQPLGLRDQPFFLNLVCLGTTSLKPHALLEFVQEVEAAAGRVREVEGGPRTLDIDILAYDDRVIDEADLVVPHPRMVERAFVLAPLAEIAPDWRHPLEGKTTAELLQALGDDEAVRPYALPPPLSGPAAPV